MSARRVRGSLTVAIVALAVIASACGVTAQDDPRPIDRKDVPFGLLDEGPTASSVPATPPTSGPTTSGP